MRLKFLVLIAAFYSLVTHAASIEHSVLVYNNTTKQVITEHNSSLVRPIASITKLMTAIVAIESYQLNDKVNISKKNSLTVEKLLTNLLIRSDNNAAEILSKHYPGGRAKFLEAMNDKAQVLGLKLTKFDDPSGLSPHNISTAEEVSKIVMYAGKFDFIKQTSTLTEVPSKGLPNTNKSILVDYKNIVLSKTGYTNPAGRCLALMVNNQNQQFVIVILGEPNKQVRDKLARNLIQTFDK